MKQFFENKDGRLSMMRLITFGCYVTGSVIAISGVFKKMPEAVLAGVGLITAGIAGKYGQKRVEENGKG